MEVMPAVAQRPSFSSSQEISPFADLKVDGAQLLPHSGSHTQKFLGDSFPAGLTHMVEKSLQILAPYHLIQPLPCIRRHRARRIPHEFAESLLRAGGEATRTEALQIRRRKNQGLAEGEFQEILKLEAEGRSVLSQEVLFEADFLLERGSGGQTRVGLNEGEDILGLGMAEGVVVWLLGGQGDKFLGDPGDLFQIAKTGVVGGKQRHSSAQSPQYYNGHLNPPSLIIILPATFSGRTSPPPLSSPLFPVPSSQAPLPASPTRPLTCMANPKIGSPLLFPSTTQPASLLASSKPQYQKQFTRKGKDFSYSELVASDDERLRNGRMGNLKERLGRLGKGIQIKYELTVVLIGQLLFHKQLFEIQINLKIPAIRDALEDDKAKNITAHILRNQYIISYRGNIA